MSYRTDAVTLTEEIIDALGEPCIYTPFGGPAVNITAVVEQGPFEIETDEGTYVHHHARIEGKESDIGSASEGEVLQVNKGTDDAPIWVAYTFVGVETDDLGKTFSWLAQYD